MLKEHKDNSAWRSGLSVVVVIKRFFDYSNLGKGEGRNTFAGDLLCQLVKIFINQKIMSEL